MTDTATATAEKKTSVVKSLLAQKMGMTQIFDDHGRVIPVTVLLAGPCHITRILTKDKNGYNAIQVAFGPVKEKNVNKPDLGQFKKVNVPASRWLREFRTEQAGTFAVGQTLQADVFSPGDYVDIQGTSKGHGFAGAVKRHNFGGGPSTHGQSDRQRAPGSSGSNTYPARVFKGKRFPGHFGVETTTIQHLEVVKVILEKNLVLVRGAVPGPDEGLVTIHQTNRRVKVRVVHASEHKKAAKKEPAKGAAPAAKPAAKAGK